MFASLNSAGLPWVPIASSRFLAFVVVITSLAAALSLLRRHEAPLNPREREVAGSASLLLLIVMLAVWGLTQETYETFRYYQHFFGDRWDRAAQMSVSLVWTLCGVILLITGIVRSHQPIRLLALGLFGMTVLKVFLFDLSFLDKQFRVLSFGGLGLALIGISWLYTRYGVGRETSPAAEPS
jgi:uncharacterized membrane protein